MNHTELINALDTIRDDTTTACARSDCKGQLFVQTFTVLHGLNKLVKQLRLDEADRLIEPVQEPAAPDYAQIFYNHLTDLEELYHQIYMGAAVGRAREGYSRMARAAIRMLKAEAKEPFTVVSNYFASLDE